MSDLQKNIFWLCFWASYFFFMADSLIMYVLGKPYNLSFFIYRGICFLSLFLMAYVTKDITND